MSQEEQTDLLQAATDELELRVGNILSRGLSDAQLNEFESLDDEGQLQWLVVNQPGYREVGYECGDQIVRDIARMLSGDGDGDGDGEPEQREQPSADVGPDTHVHPGSEAAARALLGGRRKREEPVPRPVAGPVDGVREFRLRLLFKRGNASDAARFVAFRLATVLAESPDDAWLTWDTFATTADGELFSVIRCHESIDFDVLDWVFDRVAEWEEVTSSADRPGRYLHEIVPTVVLDPPQRPSLGFGDSVVAGSDSVQAWPTPLRRSGDEFLRALTEEGGVCFRVQIAPATEDEADELSDDLVGSWPTLRHDEALTYAANPVRMRVLLSTSEPYVPARLRAVIRAGRRELTLAPLGERDHPTNLAVWEQRVPDRVLPGLAAQVLMFAPAATKEPLVGVLTADPPPTEHPLMDEPSAGDAPIRLGVARSVRGHMTDVTIDAADLLTHLQILGQTGTGKSTLLAGLAREMAELGAGFVVLDPHGTTVDRIIAEAQPSYAERVVVVRCGDLAHPVPINPFATDDPATFERAVSSFAELMGQVFDPGRTGIVGPRWERWFGLMAQAARVLMGERANLAAIQLISASQDRLQKVARLIEPQDKELASSIRSEFADRGTDRNEVLAWTGAKFQRLLGTPHLRAMIESGADALRLDQRITEHSIVLVDLAMPTVGVPAARTIGTIVLEQLWAAALQRPDRERPFFVLVDEAHLFQHGALPNILAEGRKFGLGAVIATQHQRQLSSDLLTGLAANAASLISFRAALQDARDVSLRMGSYPMVDLTRLPSFLAAATLSLSGTPSDAFTLHVDHNDRVADEEGDPALVASIIDRSIEWLVDPYRDLEPLTAEKLEELEDEAETLERSGPGGSFLDEWLEKRRNVPRSGASSVAGADAASKGSPVPRRGPQD